MLPGGVSGLHDTGQCSAPTALDQQSCSGPEASWSVTLHINAAVDHASSTAASRLKSAQPVAVLSWDPSVGLNGALAVLQQAIDTRQHLQRVVATLALTVLSDRFRAERAARCASGVDRLSRGEPRPLPGCLLFCRLVLPGNLLTRRRPIWYIVIGCHHDAMAQHENR